MTKPLTRPQEAFLDAYRIYGIVRIAAPQAGVSRELHYNAMRVSETYREAFAAIQREHALGLEEQAREIAVNGIPEPVYYGRKLVAFKRKHSDSLLIRLLEANDPEKFGRPKAPAGRRRKPVHGVNFQTRLAKVLSERKAHPRSDRSTWKRLRRAGPPPGPPCTPTAESCWDELRTLCRQHARKKTAPPAEPSLPNPSPRRHTRSRAKLWRAPDRRTPAATIPSQDPVRPPCRRHRKSVDFPDLLQRPRARIFSTNGLSNPDPGHRTVRLRSGHAVSPRPRRLPPRLEGHPHPPLAGRPRRRTPQSPPRAGPARMPGRTLGRRPPRLPPLRLGNPPARSRMPDPLPSAPPRRGRRK